MYVLYCIMNKKVVNYLLIIYQIMKSFYVF